MTLQYSIVGTVEDGSNITVFTGEGAPLVAHSSHPNWDKIVAGVVAGDASVVDLFDVSQTVASKFDKLSERVSVANGRLYFDGEEQDNSLANQVVRFITEDVEDYKPLVKFLENVQNNPTEHSRTQLYDWLSKHDFTITDEGLIVGYKGVSSNDKVTFESIHSGRAMVNGEVQNGFIKQKVGDVVEMPRGEVQHDPSVGCHTGLHVGTYEFASGFNHGALLEVHVNPRDVVSVPTDSNWAKVRVCRYTVVGTLDAPYQTAVVWSDDYDDYDYNDGDDDFDFDLFDDDTDQSPFVQVFPGTENPDWVGENDQSADPEEIPTLEYDVEVGDVYETTDKRRAGTQFKVESIESDALGNDIAVGKSLPSNLTRKVALDRLTSYRYKRVKPKKRKKV
jgi:hypothetical protein